MRIGIDIGGTKIEGLALDANGDTLFRGRVPTPPDNYDALIETVAILVAQIEDETGKTGSVGLGIPGTLSSSTGLVKNANSTCMIGKPLDRDMSDRLERPVRVANDADCFALSEARDGAGAEFSSVFGVILGTGVGGGIVFDGTLVSGPNGISGEWGHNPLPLPLPLPGPLRDDECEPRCYCGKSGCVETYLSGPGLSNDYWRHTGDRLTARQIAQAAARGDVEANAALVRYERRLALALSMVINIVDPAMIVLGGGVSNIDRLYRNIPPLLPEYVFSDTVETVVAPPRHGDSSGVRGAAWLWPTAG